MNDKLDEMFRMQKEFESTLGHYENLTDEKKQKLTKEFILYLMSECGEVLETINFKDHRAQFNINSRNTTEELVDCMKYLISIITFWGIDTDHFFNEFKNKSEVVLQRYKQEMKLRLLQDSKLVAIDVDGPLASYPEGWINYINENYGTNLTTLQEAKQRFDLASYEVMKHYYRASGYKSTIPARQFASEFTHELKKKGYTIVLLTARPYDRYANAFSDLITWAKNNDIIYDAIIFSKEKHLEVVTRFPKMQFMVEDSHEIAVDLVKLGYKVYLYETGENSHKLLYKGVIRVKNLKEILEDLDKQAAKEKK